MSLSRRGALLGATAAAVVTGAITAPLAIKAALAGDPVLPAFEAYEAARLEAIAMSNHRLAIVEEVEAELPPAPHVGRYLDLSAAELDLLTALVDNPGRTMSRDELLDKLSHREWDPFDRSIDVRVTRLRRKIELDPARPTIIKTVRGVGYVFKPTR